jgi:hypothetical protein
MRAQGSGRAGARRESRRNCVPTITRHGDALLSDVGFLGDLKRVVDLDAEVAHSRLYALVPKRLGFILRIS